jgi:hypothetical protein
LKREIIEIFKHQKYQASESYFDVALIKIETVTFSSSIRPICLPPKGSFVADKFYDRGATVTGWGYSDSSNKVASKINTADVTIYDNE